MLLTANHHQASGTLGQVLVAALMRDGFVVTAIGRTCGKHHEYPHGVIKKSASYDDVADLTSALAGQDALVEAFNPAAATNQRAIVKAAIAAGVAHLITPDFSSDTFNPYADELLIFEPKRNAQRDLEAEVLASGAITWTAIIVGAWYDWAIENKQFWIDRDSRSIMRFGSGNQKCSISRLELCGRALAAVLQSPERYRNRPAYFASHTVSTNELVDILGEITTDGRKWDVIDVPLDGFLEKAREAWHQDTRDGLTDRLNSSAYRMLGTAAIFEQSNRYSADFGDKLEPGWDEGREALKMDLRSLLL